MDWLWTFDDLLRYRGADFVGLVLSFASLWQLSRRRRSGFLFGALANAAWLVFGLYLTGIGVAQVVPVLDWIHSGDMVVDWGLRVDSLTAVMLVVITSVSALVHLLKDAALESVLKPADANLCASASPLRGRRSGIVDVGVRPCSMASRSSAPAKSTFRQAHRSRDGKMTTTMLVKL